MEHYRQRKRQGPQEIGKDSHQAGYYKAKLIPALKTDLAFIVCKFDHSELSRIPGWTGFNIALQRNLPLQKSAIHYLPVIEASPTEMATVNTIIKYSIDMADNLGLKHIVLVFDQAIYAKAQEIRWQSEDIMMHHIIVHMGEFHTCMSFIGMIGKRFGDAGLQDILIESEVVATGSINGVLNGHHYNRSVRAHKLMYEALQHLRFRTFLGSIPEEEEIRHSTLINAIRMAYPTDEFYELVESDNFAKLMSQYQEFVDKKKQNQIQHLHSGAHT